MCGHGVIALGRYAVDYNVVKPVNPETPIKIQCPCGLVTAQVEYDAQTGKTGQVRFESVPAFAFTVDQTIQVGEYMYMYMHIISRVSTSAIQKYHSVLGKRPWALKHNSRFWPTWTPTWDRKSHTFV